MYLYIFFIYNMATKRFSANDYQLVEATTLPNWEVEYTHIVKTQAGSVSTDSIANQFPIKNEDITDPVYNYYGYAQRGTLATDTAWVIVRVHKNPVGAGGELQRIAVNVAWTARSSATYS